MDLPLRLRHRHETSASPAASIHLSGLEGELGAGAEEAQGRPPFSPVSGRSHHRLAPQAGVADTMIDFLARLEPQYLLVGFTVIGGLLSMPLAMVGIRRLIDLKIATGTLLMLSSGLVLALGVGAALAAASLRTYNRLTQEQEAARVSMRQIGPAHYALNVKAKSQPARSFEVHGDEWQIDARLLKWRPIATIAGFDTVYRLERLSGRYTDLAKEQSARRTVHGLAERAPIDFWSMVQIGRASCRERG